MVRRTQIRVKWVRQFYKKNLTLDWTSNCVAENGVTISVNGVDKLETEIEQIDVAKTVVTVEPCVPLEIIVKIKLKSTQGRPDYMIIFIVFLKNFIPLR